MKVRGVRAGLADRDRIVIFGGTADAAERADTWEYDGAAWMEISPSMSPGPRRSGWMVYDRSRRRMVLFGGTTGGNMLLDETWEDDGTDWMRRAPSRSPSARETFGMIFDSARSVVVLFGGRGERDIGLSDTWEYDGISWTAVATSTAPPPRSNGGMAYDAARGRAVLFGGYDWTTRASFDDTWEYDGRTWLETTPNNGPGARSDHRLVYDEARSTVLLFGGFDGMDLDELWRYP